jgi:DtxR family Mn-dependent transcriptional regulator
MTVPDSPDDTGPVTLTASQENYLEWIFRGIAEGRVVRSRDLAAKLGVKLPSVSRAVGQLAKKGLVRHESYGVIELTATGRAAGRAIVRRDDCLTRLLVEVLGMNEAAADPEVHRLEHVLGEEVLQRLEVLVDFATSSDAWLRRLHHRMSLLGDPGDDDGAVAVGQTPVHAGSSSEKQ